VLYEVLPIAFLCEKAGGMTSNGSISLLDIKIDNYSGKSDIIIGSREEVERLTQAMNEHKKKLIE